MVSVAEFPLGVGGPAIKSWVQQSIAAAGALGELPVWTLPDPGYETSSSLRMRRAALLFLLALPGTVKLDVAEERALQGSEAPPPFDVDEVLRRVSVERHYAGGWESRAGQDVYWQDDNYRSGTVDALIFSGAKSYWGCLVIANFGVGECYVTDGTICVASDRPYGGTDPTSDNDFLPPFTTIWLAAK